MKNKNVGYLIVGISIFIFSIIAIFNLAVQKIIGAGCSHGSTCSMFDAIIIQTWISLAIAFVVLFIGVFLIFAKEEKEIVIKKIKEKVKQKKIDLTGLDVVEKRAVNLLRAEGAVFQNSLREELNVGKVKMTRLLDKLEAKQIIERKRRGMNNIVVLRR